MPHLVLTRLCAPDQGWVSVVGAIGRRRAPRMTAAGVAVAVAAATLIGGIQAATAGTAGPQVAASAVPGSQLWVSAYAGPDQGFSGGNAVAVSPDGSTVFVTGASLGSGATDDYATVAVSATTGMQLWATRYNGPAGQTDIPFAIAVSPDGGTVYVTGESVGVGTGYDFATIAYNAATGAQRWIARYAGPGTSADVARSLALSPDGTILYVTGYSGPAKHYHYVTIAYNAADGTQRWLSSYHGAANFNDQARSVVVSPDGSTVYVTGRSYGRTSFYDVATVAYNALTGVQRWVSRYNGPANMNDFGTALTVSPGGRSVYVTGGSEGAASGIDFVTIAYNAATGAARWAARYNGPGNFDDSGVSLAVTPDGRKVIVTGPSWGVSTGPDYATIAYNAVTGARLWLRRYIGAGGYSGDIPAGLALSPDGATVYVTGTSDSPTSERDYATIAYSTATGATLWVSRFTGLANNFDAANALAVNPKGGAVYVTGSSEVSLTSGDFATVAYKT